MAKSKKRRLPQDGLGVDQVPVTDCFDCQYGVRADGLDAICRRQPYRNPNTGRGEYIRMDGQGAGCWHGKPRPVER